MQINMVILTKRLYPVVISLVVYQEDTRMLTLNGHFHIQVLL